MQQPQVASLTTIGNGAAVELFDEELRKVMANINDISVDSEETREITLKVKIKPSKDRTLAGVGIQVRSKLAALSPSASNIFFHNEKNKMTPYVNNPNQGVLDFQSEKNDPA